MRNQKIVCPDGFSHPARISYQKFRISYVVRATFLKNTLCKGGTRCRQTARADIDSAPTAQRDHQSIVGGDACIAPRADASIRPYRVTA